MPSDYPYKSGYKRFRVLTIAIDAYRSAPLSTAKHGANKFVSVFREKQGNRETVDVTTLEDKGATGQAIYTALQRLQTSADAYEDPTAREEGIIIYVAGHATVRRTRDGVPVAYFAPFDYNANAQRTDWDWNTLIPLEAFTEARQFMAAKHVLFIFDCCFAGAAFSRSMLALQNNFEAESLHKKLDNRVDTRTVGVSLLKRFTGWRAYQVLAAGNYNQPVLDVRGDENRVPPSRDVSTQSHSPFTEHLLKGLDGGAADDFGMITADSLAIYLRRQFANSAESQVPRHGYLPGHDGGDFVLAERQNQNNINLALGEEAPRKKGVIVLVSPSSAPHRSLIGLDKTQYAGIEHHRCDDDGEIVIPLRRPTRRGPLQKLWLVHTPESDFVAFEMEQRYAARGINVEVKRVCIADAYSITQTESIIAEAIQSAGLPPTDLIVDVTGGTTPMSVGAARACQAKGVQMQYCRAHHLAFAGGRPDTTNRTLIPMLLKTEEVTGG